MALSDALAQFESLSVSQDVIRKAAVSASDTLADLFEFHKADYLAAGTRSINSLEPTRFTNTSTLAEAVWNYYRKTEFTRFTPRDCAARLKRWAVKSRFQKK
ncbi:hypothetical protein [Lelliottia aquatilis]|uniref:hypothetical protein n=1 Tax=Lelliottia aquatilis TaxID=2080838 RepID=UPI001A9CB5F1